MSLAAQFESSNKRESVQVYNIHGVKVHTTPSEKPFMQNLFDSLSKIPTGREAIEDMKKYNVDVFQESLRGAGGYFAPENNQIVLGKGNSIEFLEQALVHEARHLRQAKLGANELLESNLDFASWMMIYRAKEADAYTQQIKACKEWEQIGHTAPMKVLRQQSYKGIADVFDKKDSPSDAFKAFYTSKGLDNTYEIHYGINYLMRVMQEEYADKDISNFKYVSLKPADIAKCCGGDRVDEFEDFMNSKEARQMHLLTKTFAELNDERLAAHGAPRDPSLASIPVRDLKNDFFYYYGFRYDCDPEKVSKEETLKKETRKIITAAINAVEKIDNAAVKGKTNPRAEKLLEAAKKRMGNAFRTPEPKKNSLQSLLSKLGARKTEQTAALAKKGNER